MYIYCLELLENKYYIGKTMNYNKRIDEHIEGTGSKWTRVYKPIKVIFVVDEETENDENLYTYAYMIKYGVSNVRGGYYCKINEDYSYLTKNLIYDNMEDYLLPNICTIKNKFLL